MKLQYKTFLMLFVVISVIVGIISLVFSYQNNAALETQLKNASLDMAMTVAAMPEVQHALENKDQDHVIQDLLSDLMFETRYQYIIVMDMDGIQYSYPYESGLYKPYKNGGESKVLTSGQQYVSLDNNQLISAIRAFAPVYHDNQQVGAVLVGMLTKTAKNENNVHVTIMEVTLIFGIIIGIVAAIVFSLNIKKSTFGLEPDEIALLLTEKDLIFQNIERGIIALNKDGFITLSNKKAERYMGIKEMDGRPISEVSQAVAKLLDQLDHREIVHHHQMFQLENDMKILIHVCPIKNANHEADGYVISMEDLTSVRVLAEELTDYRTLVDSLRAQNHEYMNKLQTISGLIQLENYDMALDYIEGQARKNNYFNRLLTEQIRDNNIAAILLVKYELASEKKVKFYIDEDSLITDLPPQISSDDICLIIGNLIDNSIDVLEEVTDPFISIYMVGNHEHIELEVSNNGPALEASPEEVFRKGYSSKSEGRGYGLYLTYKTVEEAGGSITWRNEEEVTWYVKI